MDPPLVKDVPIKQVLSRLKGRRSRQLSFMCVSLWCSQHNTNEKTKKVRVHFLYSKNVYVVSDSERWLDPAGLKGVDVVCSELLPLCLLLCYVNSSEICLHKKLNMQRHATGPDNDLSSFLFSPSCSGPVGRLGAGKIPAVNGMEVFRWQVSLKTVK